MPLWADDEPATFWDAADLYERENGRLYVSADFGLPRELSIKDQIDLAREFARDLTDGECHPYTLAVHAGRDRDGRSPRPSNASPRAVTSRIVYRLRKNARSAALSSWESDKPNRCPGTARFDTCGGFQPLGS
jgi:hypothetical protein